MPNMEIIKYFFVGSGIGAWIFVSYLTVKPTIVRMWRHGGR